MNEILVSTENIKNMIYIVRGKQVMLDSDLAKLYHVETKRINESVRRNNEKFPERFSWILTNEEQINLKSQIATSNLKQYGGRRYNTRVFTEQGVAMLATILKSDIATKMSIAIIDAFVVMRHSIIENYDIYQSLNRINNELDNHKQIFLEHDCKLNELFSKFEKEDLKEKIYFNGQIYDAYSKLVDIISSAKKELIIIDRYADKTVLDMISKLKISVLLITKEKGLLSKLDIQKYQKQYNNLVIIYDSTFHDRYIILDRKIVYHCGTSLNKAGNKTFSIHKIEDKRVTEALINSINLKN